jgi:hypothetical protein
VWMVPVIRVVIHGSLFHGSKDDLFMNLDPCPQGNENGGLRENLWSANEGS